MSCPLQQNSHRCFSGYSYTSESRIHFPVSIFLDADFCRLNGLELGAQLIRLSPKPVIVFTTQSLSYAVRGYGIAMRYLPKPITYETFSDVMKLAMERILPQKISIFSNGTQMFIPINEIMYFEVLRHQPLIHLSSGENISVRSTLTEAISQVPPSIFAQPHKSYYINMEYVDRLLLYEGSNPYNGKKLQRPGNVHGYGLKNVEACVARSNGLMDISKKHGNFTVSIQLNLE